MTLPSPVRLTDVSVAQIAVIALRRCKQLKPTSARTRSRSAFKLDAPCLQTFDDLERVKGRSEHEPNLSAKIPALWPSCSAAVALKDAALADVLRLDGRDRFKRQFPIGLGEQPIGLAQAHPVERIADRTRIGK